MEHLKKLIIERYKKTNKKKLAITFGIVLILAFLFTPAVFAADKPNIGERILAGMVSAMADGLNAILSGFGSSIDKLVFNEGNEKTMGLTLLSNNKLSGYIFGVYQVILWLAASAYVPMGLVVAIDFKRSTDNAQHKAVLKERLIRFVLTFILLTSMPVIMDMIFAGNNVLDKVFADLGKNSLSGSGVSVDKGFLVDAFQQKATTSGSFLDACVYMMSVVLNGWLVFYYMVRDLTISFLFLLFPITAIFYPFAKGKVVGWFKEMCSNIYSQAIQAAVLVIVLGMCTTMSNFGKVADNSTMYDSVFALVAFASIIPMTGTLKRMIGLEGNVGAAASMAGLGAFMGAMALAKGATTSVKQGVGNIREGRASLRDLNAQESMLNKNASVESSVDGKELSPIHAQSQLTKEQIQGKKAEAKRQIAQGIGNLGGATWAGGSFAIGGSVFGAKGMAAGAAGGIMAGGYAGDKVGKHGYDSYSDMRYEENKHQSVAKEMELAKNSVDVTGITDKNEVARLQNEAMDRRKEELILEEDKSLGLDNPAIKADPEFYKSEKMARQMKRKYETLGHNDKAFRAYAKYTPTRKSPEELEKIEGLMMYRDKDMSVAYTDNRNDKGELIGRDVHWTGEGDSSLTYPQVSPITFNDGSTELTSTRINEIVELSRNYADSIVPEQSTPENKALHSQMQKQYYNQAIKTEQERIVNVRVELGSNRAYIPTAPKAYTPIPSANQTPIQASMHKVQELDSISQQLREQANQLASVHGAAVKDPNLYVAGNI